MCDLGYGDFACETYGKHVDELYRSVRMKDSDPYGDAFMLAGDNKAALQMAKNPVHHKKAKHIHLAWNLTREEVQKGSVAPVHVPTDQNPADLMTKGLKKVLHRRHANNFLAEVTDRTTVDLDGKPRRLAKADVVRDTLYEVEPAGLGAASDVIDKLDRVCTTDFETGHKGMTKAEAEARNERLRLCRSGALFSGAPPAVAAATESLAAVVKGINALVPLVVEAFCCEMCEYLVQELCAFVGSGMSASEREDMIVAMQTAILDSGASQTYVTRGVKLKNAVPGAGSVRIANGIREKIAERGDLGPLSGARKVNSFSRTLVSVVDTAEQVGDVLFTPVAAWVVNIVGDVVLKTKIATRTASRLYSFDIVALESHVKRLRELKEGKSTSVLNALGSFNTRRAARRVNSASGA